MRTIAIEGYGTVSMFSRFSAGIYVWSVMVHLVNGISFTPDNDSGMPVACKSVSDCEVYFDRAVELGRAMAQTYREIGFDLVTGKAS